MRDFDVVSGKVVNAAIKVHTALKPGLLESVYERCLQYELQKSGLKAETQVGLPVVYQEIRLEIGFRLDMLVEDKVIVELKAVETILPIHEAQLLTYLRLSHKPVGLLMNFNVYRLKDGIKGFISRDLL